LQPTDGCGKLGPNPPIEPLAAYLAPKDFQAELAEELGADISAFHDRLLIAPGSARPAAWAANVWYDPLRIPFSSIAEAARRLRSIQRNWALYSFTSHRRAALISEKLPPVLARPMVFGAKAPSAPLGSWTLLDPNTLLASPHCSSAFPNGELRFVENPAPPSRAYLKLWELFTIQDEKPRPGERCVDLGASPGGWTWVLQQLGARVLSVDRAPLDHRLATLPGIEYRRGSAFTLEPRSVGPVDWLFSDIICYPAKLLELLQKWLESGNVRRVVCTIKFQGATDFVTLRRFAAIPGSRLVHLHHNKHELTWLKL